MGILTKKKSRLRQNIEAILLAILIALFIRTFIVQAFKIPSGSMKETLQIGDHILVNKFVYGIRIPFSEIVVIPVREPERGDLVVFRIDRYSGRDYIKRVIGIAGDRIEIHDKQVYINHKPAAQPYAIHTDPNIIPAGMHLRDNFGPVTIPSGSIFVLGDNRDNSHDSRFWGFVDLKSVRGKAFMIYWSWDREDFGVRWERVGQALK